MPTTPINLGPSAVNTPVTAESATMRGRLGLGSSSTLNAAFENGNNNIRFTDPATSATVLLTSSAIVISTAESLTTPRAFNVSGDAVSIVSPPTFNGTSPVTLAITISPDAITTGKINNLAVTPAKLSTGGPSWNSGGVLSATSFSGPLTGNASTATTLATARTITLSGDVGGSVSFNGGADVGITTTVGNNAVTTAKIINLAVTPAKLSTGGPNWDSGGILTATSFSGPLTGNASTATILATARTITLSGDVAGSVSFNGSADVTITTTSAQATTSAAGKVELATQGEVDTGSDTARAVTPATLKSSPGAAKAWVSFNGTDTPAIIGSYNVSSITDNGTGDYTINFTANFANTNYIVTGTAQRTDASTGGVVTRHQTIAPTISAVRIRTLRGSDGGAFDSPRVDIVVFG
jgi:hypothetical protein